MENNNPILNSIHEFIKTIKLYDDNDVLKLYKHIETTVMGADTDEVKSLLTAMLILSIEKELISDIRKIESMLNKEA